METVIFFIDIIYLIKAAKIAAFLASWFEWVPEFVFNFIFPFFIFLDMVDKLPEILEKLILWMKKH